MALISTTELCRLLAGEGNPPLTKPRITQLEKDGMPKAGRDQWDGLRCMYWYLGTLRRAVRSRRTENSDGSDTSVEDERKRLLRAQADSAELELAKSRGDLISLPDHERIVADLIQETRARVRSVGPRLAQDLVGETSRTMVQAKLEKAHDEALNALSKIVPRTIVPPPEPPKPKAAPKTPKKKAAPIRKAKKKREP